MITRSEAIAILKGRMDNPLENSLSKEAFKLAIASLETDEAYQLEYERTTKNDLGVDAVSRQAINGYIDYILSHGMGKKKSFDYIKKFVANLTPATPIRPKGHWIWCVGSHKCSNCEEYTCFSHKELLRYCPNCGADMREVEE